MVDTGRTIMVIITLAFGCATGAYMAIEDFDLLDPAQGMEGQSGSFGQVDPLPYDGEPGECALHDGECGRTDQADGPACGSGGGCC
jgi:hypothetical protein